MPSSSSINPYSGRGLDKFALVTAELQAQREKLASKLGTPLSLVKFAIGSHSTWIPILLPPSAAASSAAASQKKRHSHQPPPPPPSSAQQQEDAPPASAFFANKHEYPAPSIALAFASPIPRSISSKTKFRSLLRTAMTKLAAKTLSAAIDHVKPPPPQHCSSSETIKTMQRRRSPCKGKPASADSATAAAALDHDQSRPADQIDQLKPAAKSEISAASTINSSGATESAAAVKHQKSFPIKSLARIYSGPKSPKKKEKSSDAKSPRPPAAAHDSAGHGVDAEYGGGQNSNSNSSNFQQIQAMKRSSSAMAMAMASNYELYERIFSSVGYVLALIGLFTSFTCAILLLVSWWYLMPIFRNLVGYRPVVVVNAFNQRQMPKYVSIHNHNHNPNSKKQEIRRKF